MIRNICSLLVCLSVLALWGCGGPAEPVARLEVEPRSPVLPFAGSVELEAAWEPTLPLAGLDGDPQVFVHLLDGSGEILRTFDHVLPFSWEPGNAQSYAVELWQSALAEPLAPGSYRLSLGIYDLDGHRWPLIADGEEIDDQEYVIAEVTVPAVDAAAPAAVFSDGWLPTEPGGSQQVPAVRWLVEDGGIEFRRLPGPLAVELTLAVPRLQEAGFHPVLDQGAETLVVTLRSDCLESEQMLAGYGSHDVELILTPAAESSSCAVEVDPGFVFLNKTTFEKRSVVLERLLWHS
ncbi:MAG: hypothetical protein V3T72_01255 [Thermoanaerobaculia bacterium]